VASEFSGKPSRSAAQISEAKVATSTQVTSTPRSSNLRTKKIFSDRDKDRFFKEGYEYIINFFEASLTELKDRSTDIDFDLTPIDKTRFTAAIYRDGEAQSRCTVRSDKTLNGITYLAGEDRSNNDSTFNHMLSSTDDGYSLYFQPGFGGSYDDKDKHLTFQGAAEYLWALFIEPLQR
jgi:hypothetical protein